MFLSVCIDKFLFNIVRGEFNSNYYKKEYFSMISLL